MENKMVAGHNRWSTSFPAHLSVSFKYIYNYHLLSGIPSMFVCQHPISVLHPIFYHLKKQKTTQPQYGSFEASLFFFFFKVLWD